MRSLLSAAAIALAAPATALAATPVATYDVSPGHRLAGFALDLDRVVLAEDPVARGACPVVRFAQAPAPLRRLGTDAGPTCRSGGRFWVRPGVRAIGVALDRALWTLVRTGPRGRRSALAVKGSTSEPEVVLATVRRVGAGGPLLGPVIASDWLRLFGQATRGPSGTLAGRVISGNQNAIWDDRGPVLPVGLDPEEHIVVQGAKGEIAVFHAHGRRFGRVDGARARAASVWGERVVVLRSDAGLLDVRDLDGRLIRALIVKPGARPLLDLERRQALYLWGREVHVVDIATGEDRVVARAPRGAFLIDAQIEWGLVAYAYRGGPGGAGRVVVLRRT